MNQNINNFQVVVYSQLERYNEVLSKARCRIFYKKANRNGGYITDEFADKLLSTISYVPIKGIYSQSDEDFTDHGAANDIGKIYGIVPENPNLKWENFLDEDGIERTYACVDVLLFTSLYKEASEIVGKPQSMELYVPSIKGEWSIIDGGRYFVYQDACFLGLQVLGEDVEPCFEGAAFFTLYDKMTKFIQQLETKKQNDGGKKFMEFKFNLSDSQKYEQIWYALNTKYNEENDYIVEYSILDVYDNYAIVKKYEDEKTYKVCYTKDNDAIQLGDITLVYVEYLSDSEKSAVETLRTLNNNTLEKVDENFSSALQEAKDSKEKISTFETKIKEQEGSISTLEIEKSTLIEEKEAIEGKFTQAQGEIETLKQNNQELENYKTNVENSEKDNLIQKYSKTISEDVLVKFKEDKDKYTVEDLDKELAYATVKENPSVFALETQPGVRIPKDEPTTGIEEILSRYEQK